VTLTASVTAPTFSVIGTFRFCSVSKVMSVSYFAYPDASTVTL